MMFAKSLSPPVLRSSIVRGADGRPYVVDSGNVGVDALDLDLARTWYRWPMAAAERRAFENGYLEHRQTASFSTHFPFWAIAVLTDAALFRARARTHARSLPLRRLQQLVPKLRRGNAHLA
jgi:hypothetical protein